MNKSGSVCNRLPPLSANYPWLVSQNMEPGDDNKNRLQSFYIVNNKLSSFQCQIPELAGRRIRGCYHAWLILSENNVMWSLWNPSNFIRFPPLNLKDDRDFDDIGYSCLSSPPHDPASLLLLFKLSKPHIVFRTLDLKRKKSTWIEMSYARQLYRVGDILYCPTCCNGKVYALSLDTDFLIRLDIVVNDNRQVVITLVPIRQHPSPFFASFPDSIWLKGYGTDLFFIMLGFDVVAKNTLASVYLYKLDMRTSATSTWEEMHDIGDAVFFMDLNHYDFSVFYNPAVSSELGGYLHIRGQYGNRIYSYHVKDKTVSLSAMPPLNQRSFVSLWECRLEGDTREAKTTVDNIQQEEDNDNVNKVIRSVTHDDDTKNESHLLNIPFHMLEMVMKFSLGIEYMKFRATCKRCHLAAPVIQWRSESALKNLQTYSLLSPWLMVLEQNRGIMNFTDPISGDKYFMKTLPLSIHDNKVICCLRYGWLLFYYTDFRYLVFINPFTSDARELPTMPCFLENLCFSAPPTSPNCTIVGFTTNHGGHAYILHFADQGQNQDQIWHRLDLDYGESAPNAFRFPTFYGRDLYALRNEGELVVFKEISEETSSWEVVVAETPRRSWRSLAQYFLVKRDQHHLLVTVGEYGYSLEVFELNESTKEWEKIDSLGKHTIYICGATCLCIEAKTPKMQNKIYFPRLNLENEKIVFYSLKTCRYHTFNGKNIEYAGSLFNDTKHHLYPHAWIEPSWY